ncbi:hypothetical protein SVIOM342S_03003 [Streptomyces violaceorubidus]
MADLAREAVGARLDPAVDADGARDPGAQRHEQELVGPPPGTDAALGEPAGAHVVAEGDRDPAEPLAEQRPQRYVAPAEVGRVHGDALLGVDDAGDGDTGGAGRLAEPVRAVGTQLGGEVQDARDDRLGSPLAAGRPACLVQQFAQSRQGGLHPGAAHIEGDDMSHGDSVDRTPGRGLVHCGGVDLIR